ncbi:MAG: DEAD/DEAH box helicase [Spirosomataceae bacterium]
MISKTLSLWIAQSESWQTFMDFNLPEDSIAKYPFLNRPDDFYISLFGEMYDILENLDEKKDDILPVAKGLEIFSLRNKRDKFVGVNQPNNILFAAGLYYLSDYTASAYILANLYDVVNYEREIDKFVLCFLKRKLDDQNSYCKLLNEYLTTGDEKLIQELLLRIEAQKTIAFKHNPYEFSICFLAESILKKFRTNNIWIDLLKHNTSDHWSSYIDKTTKKTFPVWDFFPSQKTALEKGILNSLQSIALQTPTSSGKTAICELLIYNEHKNNPNCKILYLAPFRALAAELKQSFGRNLSRLGISSKTIFGGNIPTGAEKELIQNVTLLIATPEKFMALENSIADFLREFTMIICDEGHLLDDGNRGLNYELLLSRLKSEKGVERKFVFISAIIPNINKINEWLGGTEQTVVRSTYRATEIEYGFLKPSDGSDKNFFLDVNPFKNVPQNYKLSKFLTESDFTYTQQLKTKTKQKVYNFNTGNAKSVAIALKSLNSGSVALFTPTKGKPIGVLPLANELIAQLNIGLNLPKPSNFIKKDSKIQIHLNQYFEILFGANYLLTQIVNYGALFHHGDLPQYVREIIEEAIRKEEIKFIICTNTLTEGVNLPIRTIVINSVRRFNGQIQETIPLRDLKNLVGRAGRAGKETKGLIIVTNPKDFGIFERLIKEQNIEDVNGHLFFIISQISKVVVERRLTLTNEILEGQDEEFKELIDAIDISIIDLLSEEIEPDDLQQTIQNLINETFAKFQSNDLQIETLNNLINLRGEIIKPFIANKEFKFIKQSGSTIRNYIEIRDLLDLDNPIWQELTDPLNDEWLEFLIKDKISKLSIVIYKLSEFNKRNRTEITFKEIINAIKLWINGKWFEEISSVCSSDIDISLRLINSLIGYQIQSAAATLIRNVEMRFEDERSISQTVLNFPLYLLYGVNTPMQLDLIEIGFSERIGIIELSNLLIESDFVYVELIQLKNYLRQNREQLLEILKDIIPKIAFDKINESFRFLSLQNMN